MREVRCCEVAHFHFIYGPYAPGHRPQVGVIYHQTSFQYYKNVKKNVVFHFFLSH